MRDAKKRAALYVRVSTTHSQSTKLQEDALREYAEKRGWTYKVYADEGQSGAKEKRPALAALIRDAHRREIDVVVVWALDRLARSLKQLLALLEDWKELGIDFVSYKQELDTSTAAGRLIFQILGGIAEFERELIRERVQAGVDRARREGKRLGRPRTHEFSQREIQEIVTARRKAKTSKRQLARRYGSTIWTISRILEGHHATV